MKRNLNYYDKVKNFSGYKKPSLSTPVPMFMEV